MGGQFEPTGRVTHVAHLVWQEPLERLLPDEDWSVEQQWMYYLIAADTPQDRVPDTDKDSLRATRLRLSRDWTGLVMRDGMALLATTPLASAPFHASARVYARSVYLDAFLLGLIQRDAARELDRRAARAMAEPAGITAALPAELEQTLLSFRSRLWGAHITDRGGTVDEIVQAVQTQYRLPGLVAKLTGDLSDIARFMSAREARRREQVSWMIGLVTAVFVVPSLVFSAAAVLAPPSPQVFGACVAISAAALGLLWLGWRRLGSRWLD
jgi:hypothetical protein